MTDMRVRRRKHYVNFRSNFELLRIGSHDDLIVPKVLVRRLRATTRNGPRKEVGSQVSIANESPHFSCSRNEREKNQAERIPTLQQSFFTVLSVSSSGSNMWSKEVILGPSEIHIHCNPTPVKIGRFRRLYAASVARLSSRLATT